MGRAKSTAFVQKALRELRHIPQMQRLQTILQVRFSAFVLTCPGMDDDAAAEGFSRRLVADDEMIVAQSQQRLGKRDLTIDRFFGLDLVLVAEQDDLAKPFGGAQVDAEPLMILDAFCRRRSDFQKCVEAIRREREFLVADDVAAFDGRALRPGQVHRDALAPAGRLDRLAMHLQAAHAKQLVARQTAHLIADLNFAAESGAGDDDAMALQDEGAVHRQAKVAARRGLAGALQCPGN